MFRTPNGRFHERSHSFWTIIVLLQVPNKITFRQQAISEGLVGDIGDWMFWVVARLSVSEVYSQCRIHQPRRLLIKLEATPIHALTL